MNDLIDDLTKYAKEHNIEMTGNFFSKIEVTFKIVEIISSWANDIINDPDSFYNNMTDEIESNLIINKDNYLKSLQVINNIYTGNEAKRVYEKYYFYYHISENIFLKMGFSVGLTHYYSLLISKDILTDEANEITSQLTLEQLSSFSDIELKSLNLKNKLVCSLIGLFLNKDISLPRYDKYLNSIELAKQINALNESQLQPDNNKQSSIRENPNSFIDFLLNKNDIVLILEIQSEFKSYEGKRLAILIYLLQVENKIISIISNSKTHSRKHFIQLFKEDSSFDKFQAVNKYIDPFTNELDLPTIKESDADYFNIKEKLTKILVNPVA